MKTTLPIINKKVVYGLAGRKSDVGQSGKLMTSNEFTCTWYEFTKK
jgi:hypothetical protein